MLSGACVAIDHSDTPLYWWVIHYISSGAASVETTGISGHNWWYTSWSSPWRIVRLGCMDATGHRDSQPRICI